MNAEFFSAIEQIEKEKGIPKEYMLEKITQALLTAFKKELIRAVRSPEGKISLDFKGKLPGRGAYVCRKKECLEKAKKSRAFERAFSVSVPDEVYDELMRQMEESDE